MRLALDAVVFRTDLYPRLETSPTTVQKYAEDLDVLPEIEVNQNNELIDGWHRWTAHKKAKAETIAVKITKTASEAEFIELAIQRNADHGLQLSQADKQDMARRIYAATAEKEREAKKKSLAKLLSVSERTVREWLSRIDKDTKEKQRKQIFDLWLACHTQDEIAVAMGWPQRTVSAETASFSTNGKVADYAKTDENEEPAFKLTKQQLASAEHATDFEPPIYNVWKQQTKTAGSAHFGNTETRWVDNLLYLYTKPFEIVIDPFAGGGSTIDICKKRLRRYWVGDRKPVEERAQQIRQHDVTDGLPDLQGRWKDVRLVYLDPPYWKQAEGQYSKDKTDLANMTLEDFNEALSGLIKGFAGKLKSGEPSYIALVIQPTQWNAPEREFTDHIADMLRMVKLPVDMRFSVPYESQQCNAQMVEWAKENRKTLVLTRELIVWKVE